VAIAYQPTGAGITFGGRRTVLFFYPSLPTPLSKPVDILIFPSTRFSAEQSN